MFLLGPCIYYINFKLSVNGQSLTIRGRLGI